VGTYNAVFKERSRSIGGRIRIDSTLHVTFIIAVICFGMYLGATHSVQQLAADAARASIAGLADDEECEEIAEQHVANSASEYPLLSADRVTVTAGALPATRMLSASPSTSTRVSFRFGCSKACYPCRRERFRGLRSSYGAAIAATFRGKPENV
jgi:hypothetical protein